MTRILQSNTVKFGQRKIPSCFSRGGRKVSILKYGQSILHNKGLSSKTRDFTRDSFALGEVQLDNSSLLYPILTKREIKKSPGKASEGHSSGNQTQLKNKQTLRFNQNCIEHFSSPIPYQHVNRAPASYEKIVTQRAGRHRLHLRRNY